MSQRRDLRTRWAQLVGRIARRTSNVAEAEDLLHSAFVRLERYRAHTPVQSEDAFLVKTAVNLSIDQHRRRQVVLPDTDHSRYVGIADPAPLQDEVLASRERLNRVKQGVQLLPARTRDILLMHRLDGLKYQEIARQLGISQSAVEKHIAKAVEFLSRWAEGW